MVQHLKSYVSWIDFVLDWTKENHRQAVVTALADKYNAYHYKLHKHYLKYASHEEALSDGMSLVEKGNGYVKASPFKRYTKMHVGSCFRQGFQQGEKQLDGTTLCGTRWRELTTTNRSNWIGPSHVWMKRIFGGHLGRSKVAEVHHKFNKVVFNLESSCSIIYAY
ncbi:uncharacterized protein LOC109002123 isoform X3 [Juglans regia]|uniref:Uncharacterized protein LOC109002123 isoform X3 n=1 Tax=Juglans regia TaxID=51240 RepID=A0A6P9E578_JUGRE|nr:uncharacterized protein LOC109002123 isoform X3 [Juglans regia]